MPFKGFAHLAQVVIFSGTKSLQNSILATLITIWSLVVWWLHSACCLLLFFLSILINLAGKLSILLIFFPRSKVWLYWPLLFFLYLINFLAFQFLLLLILDCIWILFMAGMGAKGGSYIVTQTSLHQVGSILLLQPLQCSHYRYELPHLACSSF